MTQDMSDARATGIPLDHPADGLPEVVDTERALDAAARAIASGVGPVSIDAERDMVFLPTSSPSPDYYGVNRKGGDGDA